MAKAIVGPKYTFTKRHRDKGLMRVIYSKKAPSKTYLWGKPDGSIWVWYKWMWRPYNGIGPIFFNRDNYYEDYITAAILDKRLEEEKWNILSDAAEIAKLSDCISPCELKEYIENEIEPRIEDLESIDHSIFVTTSD